MPLEIVSWDIAKEPRESYCHYCNQKKLLVYIATIRFSGLFGDMLGNNMVAVCEDCHLIRCI